jgi:hypothetical protein
MKINITTPNNAYYKIVRLKLRYEYNAIFAQNISKMR